MKKIFLIYILLFLLTGNIYASERSECMIAVLKGREIINVNVSIGSQEISLYISKEAVLAIVS